MTSPLPPRRRDTTKPEDLLEKHRMNLRQLGVGMAEGRYPPARPLGATEQLGDLEDDTATDVGTDALTGEDGDRLVLANLSSQTWTLLATPVEETLVVRWHPDGGAGVEWKRREHYSLDGGVVTITAASLAAAGAAVGDVFSAQYLRYGATAEEYTIPFGSGGWYYLPRAGSPDDDAVNFSLTDPLAAGWTLAAQTPIGINGPTVDTSEHLWIARDVPPAEAMTIRVRIEDNGTVYVNGTAVYTFPEHGSGSTPETAITVPVDVLNPEDSNHIAIRVNNETPIVLPGVNIDVQIEATTE